MQRSLVFGGYCVSECSDVWSILHKVSSLSAVRYSAGCMLSNLLSQNMTPQARVQVQSCASLCASTSGDTPTEITELKLGFLSFLSSSHFCSDGWNPRLEKSAECFRQTYLPGCRGFVRNSPPGVQSILLDPHWHDLGYFSEELHSRCLFPVS